MANQIRARLIIQMLALVLITSLFSIPIVSEVAADGINIIDYEGINPDTTQFFVTWNHGLTPHDIQVNISALEFVGATGV